MSAGLLCRASRPLPGRAADAIGREHSAHQRAVAGFRAGISRQCRGGSRFRACNRPPSSSAEVAAAVVQQYAEPPPGGKKSASGRNFPVGARHGAGGRFRAGPGAGQSGFQRAQVFPAGPEYLAVRSAAGGSCAECVVRDEGPGFTAEDKARMFRRYGRLSARPTGGEPSTGLGLSIVRKLVLAMSGELRCESNPGQGAVFTVRLPKPPAN